VIGKLTGKLFSSGSRVPEARLWAQLDRCEINFRAPMADLIAAHGTHPLGWAEDVDICFLADAKPLVKGQADPVAFEITPGTDLGQPPATLRCAVRQQQDFRLNYAHAISALVRLFGEGEEATTETAVGRRWSFGRARLSCFVFPPDRAPEARNSRRNQMFPDRAFEAAIHIEPGLAP
jgi:hypothetical protein